MKFDLKSVVLLAVIFAIAMVSWVGCDSPTEPISHENPEIPIRDGISVTMLQETHYDSVNFRVTWTPSKVEEDQLPIAAYDLKLREDADTLRFWRVGDEPTEAYFRVLKPPMGQKSGALTIAVRAVDTIDQVSEWRYSSAWELHTTARPPNRPDDIDVEDPMAVIILRPEGPITAHYHHVVDETSGDTLHTEWAWFNSETNDTLHTGINEAGATFQMCAYGWGRSGTLYIDEKQRHIDKCINGYYELKDLDPPFDTGPHTLNV